MHSPRAPEPQQRRSATPGLEQQHLGPRAPRSERLASNEDHVRAAGSLCLPGLAERLSGNVDGGGVCLAVQLEELC